MRHATLQDLVQSLPASWKQSICDYKDDSGIAHPSHHWLHNFWAVAGTAWHLAPEQLSHFTLVPVSGSRLASPAFCRLRAALTTRHITPSFPPHAVEVLSAVGCLCISLPEADCVSPTASADEPITTALAAVSADLAIPLSQLVSLDRLDIDIFTQLRDLLAHYLRISEAQREAAWSVLRQCCIFKDFGGAFTDLFRHRVSILERLCGDVTDVPLRCPLQLLPNAAWEQQWVVSGGLALPFTAVKYHTANSTQTRLLQHSGLKTPELTAFLCGILLPCIGAAQDSNSEPLLLRALRELHAHPAIWRHVPGRVFVNGNLKPLNCLVDSSSKLLKTLFHDEGQPGSAC